MNKRLAVLLGVAAILLGCYVASSFWQIPRRSVGPAAQAMRTTTPPPAGRAQVSVQPLAEGYEDLVVTVIVPAESDPLPEATSGHGPVCPQTKVSAILGMSISAPHGIIVEKPASAGPADSAGIKHGDSIIMANGEAVTCPMSLLPHIEPGPERREIELTVRRPPTSSESGATEESAQPAPPAQD